MSALPLGEISGALCCLILGSFVAGAETAVVSLPEARVRALLDELGPVKGAPLARFIQEPTDVLTRLLTFRVVALSLANVLTARAFAPNGGPWWRLALAVGAVTLAYGLLAEIAVTVGRARGRDLASPALRIIRPIETLVAPIAALLMPIGRAVQRQALLRSSSTPSPVTEREFEYLVEEAESTGALDHKRGEMLQKVLELKDMTARDVMIPRTRVHAVESQLTIDRALVAVTEEGHSRVPVYKGQIDNVIGVLHVKDLFRAVHMPAGADRPITVEAVMRKGALFIADSTSALTVLRDMQQRRMHMGMVVDEFGAVIGVVTLEDVLEQLVGDIQDEHDSEEVPVVEQSPGRYLASAAVSISKLGEQLSIEFPEGDAYASLGGFLAEQTGKVPTVGTVVRHAGYVFTVTEGDARRVTRVEICTEGSGSPTATQAASAAE